jgi:hypothetical protein
MGKAVGSILKVGGVILGVAAVVASGGLGLAAAGAVTGFLGMGAATIGLVAAGLSLGSSLLAPKPKAPAVSPASSDRLVASIDPRAARKIWLGDTAAPTDIQDQEFTGAQEFLHRFIAIASHKASQVREVWFDDKLAWTSGGGAQGEFAGYLAITPILEGSAGNAINISPRMGATRRYTGCAYLHVRYKLTGASKSTQSPFAQAIPSRVTIRGKGAPVYDVRLDSTAGGSGSQRANDQTTWAWSDSAARNPALHLLWYLLGWRINGKLAVGKGIPADRIDLESFITAANLCDEAVARSAGGTEPRYRSDGVFSEADDPSTVLDNLKAAMNAVLDDVDGKIRITVLHNDLATPRAALTTDDVLGEFKWSQTPPLTSSFNAIRGTYTDPSDASLYQSIDYPEVRIDSPDGIDRIETINLPLVQSASQAQRLVKQRLQRQLYGGMFQATFQATAWRYLKGDVVPFTFSPLGWTNKLFRIVDIEVRVDGTVPMTLREEHAEIYQWDADDAAPISGADPTAYDYELNPIYQDLVAIGDTAEAALSAAEAAGQLAGGKSTIFYQTTPPTVAESEVDDLWIDTDNGNVSYRRLAGNGRISYGGTVVLYGVAGAIVYPPWAPIDDQRIAQALTDAAGAQATADGKVATFNQEAEPVAEGLGDLWYKPSTKSLKRWDGDSWEEVATVGATPQQIALIENALTSASNAQATADGKIQSFYQATAPAVFGEGDYWTDTDDANKLYRASADSTAGGTWVAIRDTGISTAIVAAAGAQATADGKVTSFVATSAPTAEGIGDLWYNPSSGELRRWDGDSWEPTADATALVQPSVTGPTPITFTANYLGTLDPGQVPRDVPYKRLQGDADVTASTAWSILSRDGVSNTIGASDGVVNITDVTKDVASFVIRTERGGVTRDYRVEVQKSKSAPPVNTGGGGGNPGTTGSTNVSASATSTTYGSADSPSFSCVAGTAGQVALSAALDVSLYASGGNFSQVGYAKWQWRPVGGSWADVAAETASDGPAIYDKFNGPENTTLSASATKTGLTSGTTYEFRLSYRKGSGTALQYMSFSGTGVGEGS